MCGRFTLHLAELTELRRLLKVQRVLVSDWQPRYNIAPTQSSPVVAQREQRELSPMRWGLIPCWAVTANVGVRSINARVETVAELPTFREAFAQRRCIVPATGYFEWKKTAQRGKTIPHWIHPREAALIAFAGLWEMWHGPDGERIESFAVVTTDALGPLREIHERMPLELRGDQIEAWLHPGVLAASALDRIVRAREVAHLELTQVDTRVGSPLHDDPSCIEPSTQASSDEQLSLFD